MSRVGTRLVFTDDRDTGVSYCRVLLGDTVLKDDSFGTVIPVILPSVTVVWNERQQLIFC